MMAHAMISDGPDEGAAAASGTPRGGKPGDKDKRKPGFWTRLGGLLRTHPPLEERVEALEQAAAEGLVPSRAPPRSFAW